MVEALSQAHFWATNANLFVLICFVNVHNSNRKCLSILAASSSKVVMILKGFGALGSSPTYAPETVTKLDNSGEFVVNF